LPKDVVLTIGAAHYFSFPAMYTALPEGALVHFSHHFGAVGQALPLSIGVSVGHPGRAHVAMEGDGSVMMNLQELYTVTRHKIQLVLIIWNDAGYGAEVHKLKAKGFDPTLAQWQSADFAAIGKAFGGDGIRLTSEAELAPAIERGIKAGGLFIIDARVSPSEMSDPYGKLHFGRENRAPLLRRLNKGV
jgi:thiamine pyrophosphate-dependent acetolactate synthase large subunit-like protein